MQRALERELRMRIKIIIGSLEIFANLDDTPTTSGLMEVLPCTSRASTWGDEVYFAVPVTASLESGATDVVEAGTVTLTLCIFNLSPIYSMVLPFTCSL